MNILLTKKKMTSLKCDPESYDQLCAASTVLYIVRIRCIHTDRAGPYRPIRTRLLNFRSLQYSTVYIVLYCTMYSTCI